MSMHVDNIILDMEIDTGSPISCIRGTTTILGRQWLKELGIRIPVLNCQIESNNELCKLLDRYKELFSGGLGRFTGGKATLRVKEGAAPVYCRARPLPYALRDRVDHELDEMLRSGVIEPVDTSEWATPLVPIHQLYSYHKTDHWHQRT
ncbi:uncharacterized protein K02A2.6-like [Leguminivora glycinivorella]|uniref:uncharacterized protein K02A2.6-like n=1 Tax=Leguminivora glycinivorella TaxID=1035111 RepID=UPI00200BF596|nr:uncharacterized protein K02A2.6-like [Leguminivora glycinivorella]